MLATQKKISVPHLNSSESKMKNKSILTIFLAKFTERGPITGLLKPKKSFLQMPMFNHKTIMKSKWKEFDKILFTIKSQMNVTRSERFIVLPIVSHTPP